MPEPAQRSPAQPAVVLGITFLLLGLTFALPTNLVPRDKVGALSDLFSPEVANVYACVAWAGWAHFLFAFRGQGMALLRTQDSARGGRIFGYIACLAATILVLFGARTLIGPTAFGAIVWVYFIDHFIKAEQHFEGKTPNASPIFKRWLSSYQSLLSFGWLSAVLLNLGHIPSYPWILWTLSFALGGMILIFGGWRKLSLGDARGPLLSLFFVAEALVWGTISRYASLTFMTGVYVFHIAAGSYFHYLGSYFVATAKSKDRVATTTAILSTNLILIVLGILVTNVVQLRILTPILGIHWFTLWVGTHLVLSDLFSVIKGLRFL